VSEQPTRIPLFRVHPLDAPVVAAAVRARRAAAVRFHSERVLDRYAGPLSGLAAFVGDDPLVTEGPAPDALSPAVAWDVGALMRLLPAMPPPPPPEGGGLEAAAEGVRALHLAACAHARRLPSATLRRLADLLSRAHDPLGSLVAALAETGSGVTGAVGGFDARELDGRLGRPRPLGAPREGGGVDPAELTALLAGDGPLAAHFPGYAPRVEQIAMAHAVARTLGSPEDESPRQLLVEGGTGIGKSVAYLLPAILFALRNNTRVVISTNTINLQEQLVAKDIPDLAAALRGVPGLGADRLRVAVQKGKANYLCLRRWERLLHTETMSAGEAGFLARTLGWLGATRTGDRAELALSPEEAGVWERCSATGYAACPGAREGACFYRHAREAAAGAHLVVVNHALLLSDLQVGGSLLPDYEHLIVDEAHNLESEATRQFGFRVTQAGLEELAERAGALSHDVQTALAVGAVGPERRAPVDERLGELGAALPPVRERWAALCALLAVYAASVRAGEDGEVRITEASRAQPAWSEAEVAWDGFERLAGALAERADGLARALDGLEAGSVPGLEGLVGELAEWRADQGELRRRTASFVAAPDDAMVYWLGGGAGLSLNGAPLDVGPLLAEGLFERKRAVVLTSATLAVREGFAHVKTRLGADEAEELALGSPFDYQRAALLCLPTGVPEPNAPGYAEAVAEVLAHLAGAAGGRTMALFTSHAAVRSAAAALRRSLRGTGIGVLAQGVDGPPAQLVARFQADPACVLLGTASFWEGVDIANDALKVLVVARLPFNVPTEPVFAARSEGYENAFMEFAVPQAVLRFRQGFGRLIRGQDDYGAVVLLDSRVTGKAYGRMFLAALPQMQRIAAPLPQVLEAMDGWLAERGG
jgi:ATP-dependent DNA helicase DinG